MKTLLLGVIALILSSNAQAAFIASMTGKIDPLKPARILVSGDPEKLGSLFVYSVLTKAQLFKEANPGDQVIIVGRSDDQATYTNAGYKVVESISGLLKEGTIGRVLEQVKSVKSLDVYAHSNATSGIVLDKNRRTTQLLEEIDPVWDVIKKKSHSDTYIFFQGCNAGMKLGPWVAERTGLPVLAALTGTDFQHIYDNSFWSHDYNAKKENLSATNTLSFEKEASCKSGFCTRMKPDNAAYRGYWGDWSEGGYPTYKIFCGTNDTTKCGPGALAAVKSFPSVVPASQVRDLEKFKEVAIDFLCPYGHNTEKQNECKEALENSLNEEGSTYSPFKGVMLNCDFKKCHAQFKCSGLKASLNPGSCKLKNERPGANSTFTNEYKFLIEAFQKTTLN